MYGSCPSDVLAIGYEPEGCDETDFVIGKQYVLFIRKLPDYGYKLSWFQYSELEVRGESVNLWWQENGTGWKSLEDFKREIRESSP